MASKSKRQAPSSAPPKNRSNASRSRGQNGAGGSGVLSNAQALLQIFSAFQTFYQQLSPLVNSLTSSDGDNPECIPDTAPSSEELPCTSSNPAQGPRTRSQARRSATSNSQPSGSRSRSSDSHLVSSQSLSDFPSIVQVSQCQSRAPTAGAGSATCGDGEVIQQPAGSGQHTGDDKDEGKKRKTKKHTIKKNKRSRPSDTEDGTGTSSSDTDSDTPLGTYWGIGEDQSGLPLWVHERRANSHRRSFNGTLEWKEGALVEEVKTSTNLSTDIILGTHLSKRKRAKILNGHYVDIFTLLSPTRIMGNGEKRWNYGRGRYRTPRAERTFENWLDGYLVFAGVVSAAYPRRGMHLFAYWSHVRRAYVLAGDSAAITYDEHFRRNAAFTPTTRWDQRDEYLWREHVVPYVKKKHQEPVKSGRFETRKGPHHRVCWDYNKGICQRPNCKYRHECEKCLGFHPATSCFKGIQSFRGGRGNSQQGPRNAPGPSQGAAANRLLILLILAQIF
nr:uncharacterized protein LOC118097403 [Zootoca vivipara]